jgi:hypothetical protein
MRGGEAFALFSEVLPAMMPNRDRPQPEGVILSG